MIRKILLKLLKIFNPGTIKIDHPITKEKFYLDVFMHKGYWYYGRNREKDSIILFEKLIPSCSFILDIGAHIGFLSQLFSHLSQNNSEVIAFEPGVNNLPYLKKNCRNFQNITIEEKAVADFEGRANFYIENFTGQNNSLLSNYRYFDGVIASSGIKEERHKVEVEVTSIDSYIEKFHPNKIVDFIKIDVEGVENSVLRGMQQILKEHKPSLMVEITENNIEVGEFLRKFGYVLINSDGTIINPETVPLNNVFCIHPSKKSILNHLNLLKVSEAKKE